MAEEANVRVTRNKEGIWECRLYLGTDRITGRKMRPYKRFPSARSEEEAHAMAVEWASSVAPAYTGVGRNLGSMLMARVEQLKADGVKATSCCAYRTATRQLSRFVGSIPFDELTASEVERAAAEMARCGSATGGKLSRSSVALALAYLSASYREWVAMGLVERNPADGIHARGSTADYKKATALSEDDYRKLKLELAKMMRYEGDEYESSKRKVMSTATYLSLMTGMRVGEVAALRRRDLALETSGVAMVRGTVSRKPNVHRQSPKTESSYRDVPLPEAVANELRRYVSWLGSSSWGGARQETLFCDYNGSTADPDTISSWFSELARALELAPGTRYHTLRHTAATYMLGAGEDINAVKEILGHSDVRTTLAIYGHVLKGRKNDALERYAQLSSRI